MSQLNNAIDNKAAVLCLCALAVGVTLLRFLELGAGSLSIDEAYTLLVSSGSVREIFRFAPLDPNPVFAMLFYKTWALVCGHSEFILELPSAIFGICSIGVLFCLGRQLFGIREAFFAAFLLALSAYHIFFSQYLRTYSLALFLVLLSAFFLVRFRNHPSKSFALGFLLSGFLAANTHYYVLFVLAALGFSELYVSKRQDWFRNRTLRLFSLLAFLLIPTVTVIVYHYTKHASFSWIERPNIYMFASGFHSLASESSILLIIFSSCIFWTYRVKTKSFRQLYPLTLLTSWLIFTIFIPLLSSLLGTSFFHVRFFIFALPAALLLVARGMSLLPPKITLVLLCAVALSSIPPLSRYYQRVHLIEPDKRLFALLKTKSRPGDVMLHSSKCSFASALYYEPDIPSFLTNGNTHAPIVNYWRAGAFKDAEWVRSQPRVWFITTPCARNRNDRNFLTNNGLGKHVIDSFYVQRSTAKLIQPSAASSS